MCIFCEVVEGTTAAEIVLEDEVAIAFLDHRPIFPGHTLLIPRAHHETLTDLPADLLEPLFRDARILAAAVRDAMGATGTFVAMNNKVSQSVPHLHVHVVPRNPKDGLRGFFWPRTQYSGDDEMTATAGKVRSASGAAGRDTLTRS
ncbi:MAG: HIT family protein, partial [Actinomycetota bacterium]